MEKFDLSVWLQDDKSRKIITRDGREVTIEKTDIHIHGMSHMILGKYSDIYEIWHSNGRINYTGSDCNLDLFFADEEEEMTEFEKAIYNHICTIVTACDGKIYGDKELKPIVKGIAKDLLDLAIKEIEDDAIEFAKSYMEDVNPSFERVQESKELWKWKMSCLRGINKAYTQGKQDALKELPKWKKATEDKDFDRHVILFEDEYRVALTEEIYKDEYYIELEDLKTLPKEE